MPHFVYIIYSDSNHIFYKGYSMDPLRRLWEHNNGLSRFTAGKGPWSFLFLKEFPTKTKALIFERKIKRYNHGYLQNLINSPENEWGDTRKSFEI